MHCCRHWLRSIWGGLLFLSFAPHVGCATAPTDWWRREAQAAKTPAVSPLAAGAPSDAVEGAEQSRMSMPSDNLAAATKNPYSPWTTPSITDVGEDESLRLEPPNRSPTMVLAGTTMSSQTQGMGNRADVSAEPDVSDSPFHFTATGNPYAVESDIPDGAYFPDSIPEIRPNDPVKQLAPVGAVPVTVEPFEPARVLARVGSEVILAGDLLGPVNQALAPYADKVTPEQMEQQRELLIRQQLQTVIESKLMYLAFLRQIPDKSRSEAVPQIWRQVHKKFDEDELPKAMERAQVKTAQELDGKLRGYGWSINKQRISFGERALGMEGALQSIDRNPEVTHQEMLDYFEERADKYALPAAARWEQLSVRFDRSPNRQAAYEQMVRMGNEIVLGGAPFWAVAQRGSHDIQAEKGGVHDWTTQGSLASDVIDRAIFSLPIGQLSEIMEDARGFHIIRVLERREAGRVPFTEAQIEIKKKIQADKRQKQFEEYSERLRREIPVWTIYDDEKYEASNSRTSPARR